MSDLPKNDGLYYSELITITPGDSTEISIRAFQVTDETGGNAVAIQTKGMSGTVVMHCVLGQIYPVGGKNCIIAATGTTATTIIGLR